MKKKEKITIGITAAAIAVSAVLHFTNWNEIIAFAMSGIALALLARIVGDATEQLGNHFGPAATGVLQSALGNLPELFISIFALRAGLDKVVQAALIGSILGNSLLVLGMAIFIGGIKNGKQTFTSEPPRMMATLMILAFAGLAIPTVTNMFHTSAAQHLKRLDIFLAIVLLLTFIASIIFSLKGDASLVSPKPEDGQHENKWSLNLTIIVLGIAGTAAGFVSDWFIDALKPATNALGIDETFTGLIIVALAGNAVENVVGIQLAYKNQTDYSMSIIMNSTIQVALGLFPLLVLLSYFLGGAILTFVLSPMLLVCLALGVFVSAFIVFDGKSIWIEGVTLIGLYLLIAAAFWWG